MHEYIFNLDTKYQIAKAKTGSVNMKYVRIYKAYTEDLKYQGFIIFATNAQSYYFGLEGITKSPYDFNGFSSSSDDFYFVLRINNTEYEFRLERISKETKWIYANTYGEYRCS